MQALITIFLLFNNSFATPAVEKVSFYSEDSLKISADLYLIDYKLPFIILLHNSEGSRGEYINIAPRLIKLGYNCLAVDLRVGNKSNYIPNETSERAKKINVSKNFIDCKRDIVAAVKYIKKLNNKPVILLGSSFSASLSLLVAKENKHVNSVIAFSPGEFFRPETIVKDEIKDLKIPIFVSATNMELEYIKDLLSGIPDENITIYTPQRGKGFHGVNMIDNQSEYANDCWLDLLLFFKRIKNN